MRTVFPALLLASFAGVITTDAAEPSRDITYSSIGVYGGQIIPSFEKGYLIFRHRPNRLQVFGPDTQLAFDFELPCPPGSGAEAGRCSASRVAVDARGNFAVGFGLMANGIRRGGIQILDSKGKHVRFIDTDAYMPSALVFDRKGDLWTIGWERDPANRDTELKAEYNIARKYSIAAGKEIGQTLPRTMWAVRSSPGSTGGGYWKMAAASERIGALIHESFSGQSPEWVEWDLDGKQIRRSALVGREGGTGRAYTSAGKLYAHERVGKERRLRVLDLTDGQWKASALNLPEHLKDETMFLLGSDGEDLVFRVGYGNYRLVTLRPGDPQ
jgi:hypothetical protein